ncbi:MAG: 30S ribosomal protein S18 [Thermodesulfobacteriota bacterium]|nr:30S ribosomal protein S18 [Thermodesulfobacteriota bacterium]
MGVNELQQGSYRDNDRYLKKRSVFQRQKICKFCTDKSLVLDYKNPSTLRYFTTEKGKIIPRRISGNCAKHQRKLTIAIQRARNIALLPFTTSNQ